MPVHAVILASMIIAAPVWANNRYNAVFAVCNWIFYFDSGSCLLSEFPYDLTSLHHSSVCADLGCEATSLCDQKAAKQALTNTLPMILPVLAPGHNSLKLTTFGACDGFCRLASSP